MARTQARVLVSIWSDPGWLALSAEAQRTYLLLLSQPKLSLAGCLDWMPQRWERLCADGGDVRAGLDELIEARFVVAHDDELVLRTFTRHDLATTRNPKLVKGLWGAWAAILSPLLRKVVVDHLPDALWSLVEAPAEALAMKVEPAIELPLGRPSEPPTDCPIEPGIERPTDSPATCYLNPATSLLSDSQGSSGSEPEPPSQPDVRRAVRLVAEAEARNAAAANPAAYAAKVRRDLDADPERMAEITAALAAGLTPEQVASGWQGNHAAGADRVGSVGDDVRRPVEAVRPSLRSVDPVPLPPEGERAAVLAGLAERKALRAARGAS